MTSIDTNVSNYTLSELLTIVGVDNEDVDKNEILNKTNKLIHQFKTKNPQLSVFFKGVQSQLLQYADGLEEYSEEDTTGKIIVEGFTSRNNDAIYPDGEKQISDWYHNEVLTQSDKNQVEKITDRKQKIDVFNSPYVPMNREQIATSDTFNIHKQDSQDAEIN
jgi:hypothetical protein